MTLDVAARQLDMSKSNLSRIENAQIGIKPRDVRAALALYEVTGVDAEALIEIARDAQQRGWWQNYSDVLPEWFEFYVGLEAEAESLRTYEAESVPGLLQTEAYAREMFRRTAGEEGLERKVAARLRRQEMLHRESPAVELSVVLNEAVLLRPVGGRGRDGGAADPHDPGGPITERDMPRTAVRVWRPPGDEHPVRDHHVCRRGRQFRGLPGQSHAGSGAGGSGTRARVYPCARGAVPDGTGSGGVLGPPGGGCSSLCVIALRHARGERKVRECRRCLCP